MSCGINFTTLKSGELIKFLLTVPRERYANAKINHFVAMSHYFSFREGDWSYEEIHKEGNPFVGIVTVDYRDEPCWGFAFSGKTIGAEYNNDIEFCLRQSLTVINPILPVRGPDMHMASNGCMYYNEIDGNFDSFKGKEHIVTEDGKNIYQMSYKGGYINLW